MPTYEYHCTKCDHDFETFQSMADAPLEVCPEALCKMKKWGKGKVKRVIGAGAGLIFKGSGFYITDYRSENYKQSAKKEAAPAPASSGDSAAGKTATSGASSGEGKAAAKKESKGDSTSKAKK